MFLLPGNPATTTAEGYCIQRTQVLLLWIPNWSIQLPAKSRMFPTALRTYLVPCLPSVTMQPELMRTFQNAWSALGFILSSKTLGIIPKNLDLYKYHSFEVV